MSETNFFKQCVQAFEINNGYYFSFSIGAIIEEYKRDTITNLKYSVSTDEI